jgi:tRNA(Ile)-lysidine synthase
VRRRLERRATPFLRKVKKHTGARAILTAHHHDDAVETAVLNLMRGTSRKGLTSLRKSHEGVHRPLLHYSQSTTLKSYAEANGLTWNEDSTNQNQDYRRNYVRHSVLPKLKAKSPQESSPPGWLSSAASAS